MVIDKALCKNCLDCRPVCPMGAIQIEDKAVVINLEDCVECGVCLRYGICQEGAIKQVDEIPYPRIVRAIFSDPVQKHESTGIQGRGTEEMKTNDVTNLFTPGKIGFSIELGRPGVGAYLSDLDRVTREVFTWDVELSRENPVFQLIEDHKTGALRSEVLGEKVLSAIVELLIPEEKAIDFIFHMTSFLNQAIDSVATISAISRADDQGHANLFALLEQNNIAFYPNGKVNIGLAAGREVL